MSTYETFPAQPYDRNAICCPRVAVHPRGAFVVTQTSDELQLRHAHGGRPRLNLELEGVQDFSFSPDGKLLAVGLQGKVARILDVESGEEIAESESADDYIDHVVWLGGSQRFATASARCELAVHALSKKTGFLSTGAEVVRELLGPDPQYNSAFGLAASPDGARLFFASGESLRAFDVASGILAWRRDFESSGGHVTVSPDGRILAMAMSDGTIQIFEAASGRSLAAYAFRTASGIRYPGMIGEAVSWSPRPAFSPDGAVLVSNTPVGSFVMIDPRSGAPLWEAARAPGLAWIEDVAWTPDGQHLFTACSDGVVGVWSMRPVAPTAMLQAYDDADPEIG